MGRRVCPCMQGRLFCFLPPWPALDPWPSLLTGLDSSNSVLQGFDLVWGRPLQSLQLGWRRGGAASGEGGAG